MNLCTCREAGWFVAFCEIYCKVRDKSLDVVISTTI